MTVGPALVSRSLVRETVILCPSPYMTLGNQTLRSECQLRAHA